MPRYTRMQVLGAMYETGLVPVFFHADVDVVIQVAKACARSRPMPTDWEPCPG